MHLTPNYDDPELVVIEGRPADVGVAVVRQRRRFEQLLDTFDERQWQHATRCDSWSARDVIAHLVTVNDFWAMSVLAGIEGAPTRVLATFDPAAHPPLIIAAMAELSSREIFDRFAASNIAFFDALDAVESDDWSTVVETPVGHVPVWSLAHHALWDAWIHERDILLPQGQAPAVEPDEVAASLRYVAAFTPALRVAAGEHVPGAYGIDARGPDVQCTIEVGDTIVLRDETPPAAAPCLRGPAVELVEALSVRAPLPDGTPAEWRDLARSLAAVFDATAV